MSGVNNWCLFRSSGKVKQAIKYQMKKKELSYNDIAKMAGVRPYRTHAYLNHIHEGNRPSITQFQLMKICNELGINVTINIEM